MSETITVAAAHLAPVYLDAQATVDKACIYIRKAADAGVQLVAFPESFVPGSQAFVKSGRDFAEQEDWITLPFEYGKHVERR